MGRKRKPSARKPDSNSNSLPVAVSNPQLGQSQFGGNPELDQTQTNMHPALVQTQTPCNNAASSIVSSLSQGLNLDPDFEKWKCYTEEKVEELVLKKLALIYHEAYLRVVSHGYSTDIAVRAILTNGHCFGTTDILTNIAQNAISYIQTGKVYENVMNKEGQQIFWDMKVLVKHSLQIMIYLLRHVRPNMTKREAMWCLLMSNFHLSLATTIDVPHWAKEGESNIGDNSLSETPFEDCAVHKDLDSGNGGTFNFHKSDPSGENTGISERDSLGLRSLNLSPTFPSDLKRIDVNTAEFPEALQSINNTTPCNNSSDEGDFEGEGPGVVSLDLDDLNRLSLDDKPDGKLLDKKNAIISSYVHQINELEQQVAERKEWAHKTVIQAAKKLNNDLLELKMLRMEKEERQQLKSGKLEIEEETMTKLMEMEDAMRIAGCRAELATQAAKKVEINNSEIRAEIEAFKLSASESDKICMEFAKGERKYLKKISALEKQYNSIQKEIEEEQTKYLQLQQQLLDSKRAREEMEVKWRQEVEAKELAFVQLQEELRLKEETEVNIKRREEALRLKIELDRQRCEDDIKRLKVEISHLQMLDSANQNHSPDSLFEFNLKRFQEKKLGIMLPRSNKLPDLSEGEVFHDRKCVMCMENEPSVVFLPCAHQVICANCNEDNIRRMEDGCIYCQVQIAERIRVYGAS